MRTLYKVQKWLVLDSDAGVLYEKLNSQCCGGEVFSDDLICCHGVNKGSAHGRNSTKFCCGADYVDASTSVCCVNDIGQTQVSKIDAIFKCLILTLLEI